MTDTLTFTMRPVDADRDAVLLHAWVSEERAAFWGMRGKPADEVRDIYAWIGEQEHLAAYLVSVGDDPFALFQTYDPTVDEIGSFYERRPGDLGIHLFIGPGDRPSGSAPALAAFLLGEVFADPAVRRIVLEPDVRNAPSLALVQRLGATLGPVVDLPTKTAQFAFIERP